MKHVNVLDIGSSKVASICAGRIGEDGMAVYGAGVQEYAGYRFAELNDKQDLGRAIAESLRATQKESGLRMNNIAVSVPAPFTRLIHGSASLRFEEKPKRITSADIDTLISNSLPEEPPEGFSLMHSTPYGYVVDTTDYDELPGDILATDILAQVSHVYVEDAFMELVQEAIRPFGSCSMCVSSLLCEAMMLVPEDKWNKPAVVIDVGHTHTDICVLQHSALMGMKTLEVGGMHITNDLAYCLEISRAVAETVKRKYVFNLDYQDSVELLRTPEGTQTVNRAVIQEIVEERVREWCLLVYDAMQELGVDVQGSPLVYLTGGGLAMMRGSLEFLAHTLEFRVRKEMPWMPRLNSANYASLYGAVEFVLSTGRTDMMLYHAKETGVLQKLRELFARP
ncbi:hypothetical protein LJC07_00135 [Christensenellaceae bacterium OttesenSCG-928-L17]|nr:hypothetical protein [Christensenellaceae bacterium OttesenSCG-928-L17]